MQLSTAEGVVVTKADAGLQAREDGRTYVFDEDGTIIASHEPGRRPCGPQSRCNMSSGRPMNDRTERLYAELELRSEIDEHSRD